MAVQSQGVCMVSLQRGLRACLWGRLYPPLSYGTVWYGMVRGTMWDNVFIK